MDRNQELNRWRDYRLLNKLSQAEISLMSALYDIGNMTGWKDWFEASNALVQAVSGIGSRETIRVARDKLKQRGLIDFHKGKKNKRPPAYHIVSFVRPPDIQADVQADVPPDHLPILNYFINSIDKAPSPLIAEKLRGWHGVLPDEVITRAIDEAVKQNKRSYSYVDSILRAWREKGLNTLSLVEGHLKGWEEGKKRRTGAPEPKRDRFVNFKQRSWDFEAIERAANEDLRRELEEGLAKEEGV